MRRLASLLLAAVVPVLPAAAPAGAVCGLVGAGAPDTTALAELPEGVVTGQAECQGIARQVTVWTLLTDPDAADLGIRDRPLFRSRAANPLVPVAGADVGETGRITLFKRREDAEGAPAALPDLRPPFRLFGTFCDRGAAEPLDCRAGPARVKMRADVIDADLDGALDRVQHQVSIWNGADRLQVLMFETPHAGRPLSNAVPWIEALALAGRL